MKLVVDSNVWVSALVFGGNPRAIIEKCHREGFVVAISEEIITETRRVLLSKFPDFFTDFEDLLLLLSARLENVKLGEIKIEVCRDEDDNRVLETAVLAKADIIVTGDKDLLVLQEYEKVKITTPAEFMVIE